MKKIREVVRLRLGCSAGIRQIKTARKFGIGNAHRHSLRLHGTMFTKVPIKFSATGMKRTAAGKANWKCAGIRAFRRLGGGMRGCGRCVWNRRLLRFGWLDW